MQRGVARASTLAAQLSPALSLSKARSSKDERRKWLKWLKWLKWPQSLAQCDPSGSV